LAKDTGIGRQRALRLAHPHCLNHAPGYSFK
jgi:hypothetical protein